MKRKQFSTTWSYVILNKTFDKEGKLLSSKVEKKVLNYEVIWIDGKVIRVFNNHSHSISPKSEVFDQISKTYNDHEDLVNLQLQAK